jgi:hypothetical protein
LSRCSPQSPTRAAQRVNYFGCRTYCCFPFSPSAAGPNSYRGVETNFKAQRRALNKVDASRIRKNPGVFARLSSFVHNILNCNQTDTNRVAAAFGGLKSGLSMTSAESVDRPGHVSSSRGNQELERDLPPEKRLCS